MRFLSCVGVFSLVVSSTTAFVPNSLTNVKSNPATTILKVSNLPVGEERWDNRSFLMSREEINPLFSFGDDKKEKLVNAHGLWCLFVSLITCPIWLLAMAVVHKMEDDENRALYDKTGKIWSKAWLTATNSYPTISGNFERLKEGNDLGACLFVANHASWLDIPVLCTVLDPVFKFISKAELGKLPCIGDQLKGGEHILIERDDRKSQLKTFKQGISWLRKGVPIMAFPEGQRSHDGRLMDFKGGLFLMAAKTKVPIVPITISHAHSVMPSNGLFPVQPGANKLHVHVHEAIDAEGKTEEELAELVRACFASSLPMEQQPEEKIPSGEEILQVIEEEEREAKANAEATEAKVAV